MGKIKADCKQLKKLGWIFQVAQTVTQLLSCEAHSLNHFHPKMGVRFFVFPALEFFNVQLYPGSVSCSRDLTTAVTYHANPKASNAYCWSSSGDDRGRLVTRHLISTFLRSDWLVFNSCNWRISILAVSVNYFLGGPLSYGCCPVSWLWASMLLEFLFPCPCFLGWSLMWITSLTLRVPMRITTNKLTSFQSVWCSVSCTAEVWVRASRMSRSCSLILSCMGLPVSPM